MNGTIFNKKKVGYIYYTKSNDKRINFFSNGFDKMRCTL